MGPVNTMKLSLPLALAAACAAFTITPAQAVLLIDTSTSSGLSLSNSVGPDNWIAERFTLGGSQLQVDSISAFVMSIDPDLDAGKQFTLAIYANDASRNLPALNFNADNQGRLFSTSVTYSADGWTGASGLHWALAPGSYWFAIESDASGPGSLQVPSGALPAPDSVAYFYGHRAYSHSGVDTADAFGLHVTAVPEPGQLALLLGGLALLGTRARVRRAVSGRPNPAPVRPAPSAARSGGRCRRRAGRPRSAPGARPRPCPACRSRPGRGAGPG